MATPTQRNRLVPSQNRMYSNANISLAVKFSISIVSKSEKLTNQFKLAYQNIYSLLLQ